MFFRMLLTQVSLQFFANFPPEFDLAHTPHPPCRIFSHVFAQNDCGACVAFAVATAAAARACVREKRDWIPSPYRLFACGGGKCKGGSTIGRLVYALNKGGGLVTEFSDNETEADFRQPCPQSGIAEDAQKAYHSNIGWPHWYDVYPLDHKNWLQIKQELYMYHNPVLMIMEPDTQMAFYTKSPSDPLPVFHSSDSILKPSHVMVILGWGSTPEPHWIVQNSWGNRWGDDGRGKLAPDSVVSAVVLDARGWRTIWVIFFNMVAMMVVLLALEGRDWWRNRGAKEKDDMV
jgi:hypothetical protein